MEPQKPLILVLTHFNPIHYKSKHKIAPQITSAAEHLSKAFLAIAEAFQYIYSELTGEFYYVWSLGNIDEMDCSISYPTKIVVGTVT